MIAGGVGTRMAHDIQPIPLGLAANLTALYQEYLLLFLSLKLAHTRTTLKWVPYLESTSQFVMRQPCHLNKGNKDSGSSQKAVYVVE